MESVGTEDLVYISRKIPHSCDVTFFIPCLNEEGNISVTLEKVIKLNVEMGHSFEILIFDDASADGTVKEVQAIQKKYSEHRIRLVENKKRRGLARNFVDGSYVGAGEHYMLICGDDAEPSESYRSVLERMGRADMIIPVFRELDQRQFGRRMLSLTFTFLVNIISGNKIYYYNGPTLHKRFNIMRWHADTDGFAYQAEVITRLMQEGATCEQVLVENSDREQGVSTAISFQNLLAVGHSLFQILLRRIRFLMFGKV